MDSSEDYYNMVLPVVVSAFLRTPQKGPVSPVSMNRFLLGEFIIFLISCSYSVRSKTIHVHGLKSNDDPCIDTTVVTKMSSIELPLASTSLCYTNTKGCSEHNF